MANPKSKRRRKLIVFAVLLLVIGGLTAAAFLRKREAVITVQTEKVTRRNLTEIVVANGRVQPVVYVKISPEVSGEIIELPVKEGQAVKKGDLLVRIKPDTYIANSNSATASYRASLAGKSTAEANLARAEAEFRRQESLYRNSLVSESLFVDARTSYEVAQAQLRSATHQVEMSRAALDRAEEDLRKTVIHSPLEGTVIRLNSQLGERVVGTAMMAGTEIMTIADLNEMEARVEVGEVDVPLIQVGQVARLEGDAFKDRKFNGVVTEIANSSRGLTLGAGTGGFGGQSQEATKFEVKIRIKDKEAFRPGMSFTAEIETRYRTNVLTVPIASVTTRLPKTTNSVAKAGSGSAAGATNAAATPTNAPSGRKPGEAPKPIEVVFLKDGDVARMVPIKRGISDDAYMEITEGLEEGQEVISGGFKAISRDLEDGKKIKVGPPPGEKGKPPGGAGTP
ncbi:MAG: efflux RND transporter periplasmic adaptor subunit [Verrucomicrobia bacterium]|nr:efflux RND transporter periplasmic adaptor subunit [Verrucomicrobiota bacterium]